jgi:hypothetical protein
MADEAAVLMLSDAEAEVASLVKSRDAQASAPTIRLVVHVIDLAQPAVPAHSLLMNVGKGLQTYKWLSLAVSEGVEHLCLYL